MKNLPKCTLNSTSDSTAFKTSKVKANSNSKLDISEKHVCLHSLLNCACLHYMHESCSACMRHASKLSHLHAFSCMHEECMHASGMKICMHVTVKVKNSSPKSLSANCRPAVYQQLTDSKPTLKNLTSVMTSQTLDPYRSIRISRMMNHKLS